MFGGDKWRSCTSVAASHGVPVAGTLGGAVRDGVPRASRSRQTSAGVFDLRPDPTLVFKFLTGDFPLVLEQVSGGQRRLHRLHSQMAREEKPKALPSRRLGLFR